MEQTCFHQCLYSVVQLQDTHFLLKIEYYIIISISTGKFLMGLNLKSCQHFRHKVKIWAAIEYCTQCTPSSFSLVKTCRSCLFHNNILIFCCLSYHILQRHNMQIPVVTSQTLQGTFVVGICAAPSCGSAWSPNRLHCCLVITVVYFVEPCLTKYRAVATRSRLPIFSWQAHACEKSFSFLNLHGIQFVCLIVLSRVPGIRFAKKRRGCILAVFSACRSFLEIPRDYPTTSVHVKPQLQCHYVARDMLIKARWLVSVRAEKFSASLSS